MRGKNYISYAIYYLSAGCGCEYTTYAKVYDCYGNKYKRFDNYEDAKSAAIKKMKEKNADNWQVLHVDKNCNL